MKELKDFSFSELNSILEIINRKIPSPPYPGHYQFYKELFPIWEKENEESLIMRGLVQEEIIKRLKVLQSKLLDQIKEKVK